MKVQPKYLTKTPRPAIKNYSRETVLLIKVHPADKSHDLTNSMRNKMLIFPKIPGDFPAVSASPEPEGGEGTKQTPLMGLFLIAGRAGDRAGSSELRGTGGICWEDPAGSIPNPELLSAPQ